MATSDEQKQELGELAARALDAVDEFGPEASLGDAVLVYEVDLGNEETLIQFDSMSNRAPLVAGLLTLALQSLVTGGKNTPEGDE